MNEKGRLLFLKLMMIIEIVDVYADFAIPTKMILFSNMGQKSTYKMMI